MKELIEQLKIEHKRRNTVLVLHGVGVNFWLYFPFLNCFSLVELSQFKQIYGMSGASGAIWLWSLSQKGMLDDKRVLLADRWLTKHMNRKSLMRRLTALARGDYVFEAKDLVGFISEMTINGGQEQQWKDCFLDNLTAVAHDYGNDDLLLLSQSRTPDYVIVDSLCAAGLPRKIGSKNLCREFLIDGKSISDFDFSGPKVQEQFKSHLKETYPNERIVRLNLFKSGERGNSKMVKVTNERFPLMGQLLDFGLPLLGLRNSRLRNAHGGKYFSHK